MNRRDAYRAVWWAAVPAAVFVASSFLAPILSSAGHAGGALLRLAFSPLCHQMPERSLAIANGTQAVCARCSGLYLGALAGLLVGGWLLRRRRFRPSPWWLVAALAPSAMDFVLPWLGLSGLPNLPRLALALPAGFVAALFLAVGIEDLFSRADGFRLTQPFAVQDSRALEETDG